MVHRCIEETGSVHPSRSCLCRGLFSDHKHGRRKLWWTSLHTLSPSDYGPGEVFAISRSFTLGEKVLPFSHGS